MMASLYQNSPPSSSVTGSSVASIDDIRFMRCPSCLAAIALAGLVDGGLTGAAVNGRPGGRNKKVGADQGARGSPGLSVHGDAIDMELTSRFVKARKETLYLCRKPLARHWFPRELHEDNGVVNLYPVLPSGQFRDHRSPLACNLRAE